MLSSIQKRGAKLVAEVIRPGSVIFLPTVRLSTPSSLRQTEDVSTESLGWGRFDTIILVVNDVMFDKLIRKPYEQQRYNIKYPSNIKFAAIVTKHVAIDTSLV